MNQRCSEQNAMKRRKEDAAAVGRRWRWRAACGILVATLALGWRVAPVVAQGSAGGAQASTGGAQNAQAGAPATPNLAPSASRGTPPSPAGPQAFSAAPQAPAQTPPPPRVEVASATRGVVLVESEVPARLTASRRAEVRARVEGIVEAQRYREGEEVRAGQTLFELDARPYQAALAAAEALVAQRQAELKRQQSLVAQGFASQQTLDLAKANLAAAEAQRTEAALKREYARVPAPIAGRAGRALVTEGALVGKGEATLLTTVEVIDPIHALITEPLAQWQLRQRLGAAAPAPQLVIEGEAPRVGRWIVTDWQVDPNTHTVTSKAEFPNPDRRLLPGMFVRVRVPTAEREAVTVPQRAIASGAAGLFVWVVEEGRARLQPVTLGGFVGERVEVTSGLQGGEPVVVAGQARLRPPGGPVTVARPSATDGGKNLSLPTTASTKNRPAPEVSSADPASTTGSATATAGQTSTAPREEGGNAPRPRSGAPTPNASR